MAKSSKSVYSFFIVPDEKENYSESVQLGNVLYTVAEPDNLVSKPRLADGPHPLGIKIPPPRKLSNYTINRETEKGSKIGFFAKILELVGFGANISRKGSATTSESYTVKTMEISTFKPSKEFLEAVKQDRDVKDVLSNTQERCVFLITGVVVATGVEFKVSDSNEKENEGSLGISSHGVSVGPSGSKRRKTVLEVGYTDEGPVTLAFRVQKLQLKEDGTVSAEPHVEGAYFGNDGKKYIVDENAPLDSYDTEGLENSAVVDEISGEEYSLYV